VIGRHRGEASREAASSPGSWPILVVSAVAAVSILPAVLAFGGIRWWAVALAVAAVTVATWRSADAALWAIAFLPFSALVRRMTSGPTGYSESDPLAVLALLLLIPCALLALLQIRRRLRDVPWQLRAALLAAVASGLLGMTGSPGSALVNGLATLPPILLAASIASGFWKDLPARAFLLVRAATPVVALYGIVQYLRPLQHDLAWLFNRSEAINSIGTPLPGQFRVFSTLESPGPCALFLAVGLGLTVVSIAHRVTTRRRKWLVADVIVAVITLLALSLTSVRTGLFSILVSLFVWTVASGRLTMMRSLLLSVPTALVALQLPALLAPGLVSSDRFNVSSLSQDASFQARLALLGEFGVALRRPFGAGLGATDATAADSVVAPIDNGFLVTAIDFGALGFLAVVVLLVAVVARSLRGARTVRSYEADAAAVIVLVFLCFETSGPSIFSRLGLIFWVAVGYVFASTRFSVRAPVDGSTLHGAARVGPSAAAA
jgi:putative inorganic carbon (HCO3(-)) transporter